MVASGSVPAGMAVHHSLSDRRQGESPQPWLFLSAAGTAALSRHSSLMLSWTSCASDLSLLKFKSGVRVDPVQPAPGFPLVRSLPKGLGHTRPCPNTGASSSAAIFARWLWQCHIGMSHVS